MLTRRIAAGACALCLVVPTVAAANGGPASVGHIRHAVPVVATGDTKNDLHVETYEQAISGDTKGRLPRAITHAPPSTKPVSTAPAGRATPVVAGDGTSDGWQIAALAEAGLIAVVALAAAGFMTSRTRREAHPGV